MKNNKLAKRACKTEFYQSLMNFVLSGNDNLQSHLIFSTVPVTHVENLKIQFNKQNHARAHIFFFIPFSIKTFALQKQLFGLQNTKFEEKDHLKPQIFFKIIFAHKQHDVKCKVL